ncbi:nucleotidyltransferase family protein [Humibacter ginsenosidimutans]|uniref:nucleotidyltransferase family protein n=1 Tax=Humibacter ginsenosidimutans TaxID=2599293 RepID=UPI00143CFB32|nr:nucleotidyltransferase family protein [Humibacter ginsenosidimutans]
MQSVPVWARVHLTHAALQAVADEARVDILHIKGPTDAAFRAAVHDSTDADVLVRPEQLETFVRALRARGWSLYSDFDEGSPFGHAANYQHPSWTWVDVHRRIPGFRESPETVFDRLWRERGVLAIAHRPCTVLSPRGQVLVQTMHVARSHGYDQSETWQQCPEQLKPQVRALAEELEGQAAFAAGIGELELHRDDPDYALWDYWSREGGDRLEEWRARFRSAEGFRARMRVLARATRVNRTHLRIRLGHEPTGREVVAEQFARVGKAAGSAGRALASRLRGHDDGAST